jgi:hypothetical protein
MTEDSSRTVSMLWGDHTRSKGNATLGFVGTSSSTGGKYTAAWYGFNSTDPFSFLSLDPEIGIKSLGFVVDGTLENQGGLGFAIQDSFMFSEASCVIFTPLTGRFDIAVRIQCPTVHSPIADPLQVRNGVHPSRVYLEEV